MKKLHKKLIDMTYEVHKALAEDVDYTITAGTAIGAVRDGGPIPWDDDVDIMISHKDAHKFIELLEERLPKRYKVIKNEKWFPYKFLRVIDLETELVGPRDGGYGWSANIDRPYLWIDVFSVAECKKKKRPLNVAFWTGLYFARTARHEIKWLTVFNRALKVVPHNFLKWKIDRLMSKGSGEFQYYDFPHDRFAWRKIDISNKELINFGGKELYIAKDIHLYLEDHYGDYMTPPPKNEQWTHDVFLKE